MSTNLELMKTLDDAWNAGPSSPLWEIFKKRHSQDVKVYWPAQPNPTIGRQSHDAEAQQFFKTFDNKLSNNSYQIMLAQGEYICTVADWAVTMKGSKVGSDGKTIPPTGKTAQLEFCRVATWKNGEITEDRLFYDVVGMIKQLGIII